jgi:PilZ domain-containing protein
MVERRRDPRYPASWQVLLWPTEDFFLFGRAADVSRRGMRFVLSKVASTVTLSPGGIYRVDVNPWPWPHAELKCTAVVRHLSGDSVGVETQDGLPVERLFGRLIVDKGVVPTSADTAWHEGGSRSDPGRPADPHPDQEYPEPT